MPASARVGDRLVLERQPVAACCGSGPGSRARRGRRGRVGLELVVGSRARRSSKSRSSVSRRAARFSSSRSGEQPVGGEDRQAGIREGAEEHQHVAVLALAADLLRVDARGLVAVVAVGDQQLGVGQRGLHRGDRRPGRSTRQSVLTRAVERRWRCRTARSPVSGSSAGQALAVGVGEQAEDGGEVGARGARELAGGPPSGPGACARAGGCGPARTPPRARGRGSRGGCGRCRRGPRSPGVSAHIAGSSLRSRARPAGARRPWWSGRAGRGRRRSRAGRSISTTLNGLLAASSARSGVIDHVVRGRDDVVERADDRGLVAQRLEWLDLGHGRRKLSRRPCRGPRAAGLQSGRTQPEEAFHDERASRVQGFLLRGNVVDLAVAVVIGVAFIAMVTALVRT